MGEHFRKEVPASDNVSLSLIPFFCGVAERGVSRENADGFLLFSRFKEEISAQSLVGARKAEKEIWEEESTEKGGAWRRVRISCYLIFKA